MKPLEVRKRIAKLMGVDWDRISNERLYAKCVNQFSERDSLEPVPDPWTDLNAIKVAVRTLNKKERVIYVLNLHRATCPDKQTKSDKSECLWSWINATPEQCCEAYLRTKGEWVNE